MAKTTTQKLSKIDEQIKALEKEKRQLRQKEKAEADKERIRRQSNRGGLIEKIYPHLATLNEQEFENYMKKVLSPPVLQSGILTKVEVIDDEE